MNWNSNEHKDGVRLRLKGKLAALDAEERAFLLERIDHALHGSPASVSNLHGELRDLGWPRGET